MALKAIKDGQISGYPEYTSTALGSFFQVPASKIPSNATQAYDEAKADLAKEGIVAFPPTPFADSNAESDPLERLRATRRLSLKRQCATTAELAFSDEAAVVLTPTRTTPANPSNDRL